ncbi:MAG: hypothetical protein Q9209_004374 [Squamulea sp. 1 TL-2023]
MSSTALESVQKLLYASDFFFLFTVWASKCSMALLFTRLTPRPDQKKLALGLRVIIRWDIIGAIDITTEVALFAMAILLVKDLKLDISKKAFVVIAFGVRLPMIAVTILRLKAAKTWLHSSDPTFSGVFFIIWSIVEAHFSICSSNIACLKPFIAAFNTSFGGSAEINELSRLDRTGKGSNSASNSKSGSKIGAMNSIRNLSTRNKGAGDKQGSNGVLSSSGNGPTRNGIVGSVGGKQELGNEVDIIHEDTGSIGSGGSRQMIIQKDVTWDVEYSTAKPAKGRVRGTP